VAGISETVARMPSGRTGWRPDGSRTPAGTAPVPRFEPRRGFSDGEVLDMPGSPRVVHAPGHTGGSAAILLEDRSILFTGDVLCTHNAYTGRDGPQIMPSGLNADTPQALASLANLAGIKAGVLLPGHGEPWTEGVEEAIRQARAAGPS
jgi:glyoxylase-like metal-dependent hydrolase (beta-lactamase superfamily II)